MRILGKNDRVICLAQIMQKNKGFLKNQKQKFKNKCLTKRLFYSIKKRK